MSHYLSKKGQKLRPQGNRLLLFLVVRSLLLVNVILLLSSYAYFKSFLIQGRPFHDLFQLLTETSYPLSPKSDEHQFSPNNISRSLRVKVMRITKLITKGRTL